MTEDDLQIAVAQFLWAALPPGAWFSKIVNEAPTRKEWRIKQARQGRKSGIPDYLICYQGESYFVEMKTEKGVVSADQKLCHAELKQASCPVAVCRSVEDVETFLSEHMTLRGRIAA